MLAFSTCAAAAGAAGDDASPAKRFVYARLSDDGLGMLEPAMRMTLIRWMVAHPPYRLMTFFHCDVAMGIAYTACETRLSNGHPYVARGDFNSDGRDDSAILLEREAGAGPAVLLVFNGPFDDTAKAPAFVHRKTSLTDVLEVLPPGDVVPLQAGHVLLAGPPGDYARVWPLSDGTYTFEWQREMANDDDIGYVLDDGSRPYEAFSPR